MNQNFQNCGEVQSKILSNQLNEEKLHTNLEQDT